MEALRRLCAADLARVMSTYRQALDAHKEAINRLNVYPVPDGDTGTNMALTVDSVVNELDADDGSGRDMAAVCKAITHGSLMGARGNSGVILSQLLRGLVGVFTECPDGDCPEAPDLARALEAASEAAYKAVLRPAEGTILTVARAASEGAKAVGAEAPLVEVLESARNAAKEGLERTPELLPVLAQANVVDAGGVGYLLLLDSLLKVVDGRPLPDAPLYESSDSSGQWTLGEQGSHPGGATNGPARRQEAGGGAVALDEARSTYTGLRYEVMYFLHAPDEAVAGFKDVWEGIGDSIVVVGGDGLWNCHIHTDDVGAAIEAALDVGRPRDIRVSDLAEQIDEERWVREAARAPAVEAATDTSHVRTAAVAVANGEGVGRIFRSLGVHHLVPGGQSMNPSTEEILRVVEDAVQDEVVILPNNENIVPVAMQVCELAKKTARVVPTSGIVEGFAALLEYDPQAGAEENVRSMSESARRVVAGEVTQAVRDSSGTSGPIKAGEWMGLSRDGIEVVGSSMAEAACGLLGKLLRDEHELVTIIEGEGAARGQTREITEWLSEHRTAVAVEVHHGGQPLYPYLFSIE